MVDIGKKAISTRRAHARARVHFPSEVAEQLRANGYSSKKGAIVHSGIIAGVMAAKSTHTLIPFCHALALERCDITICPDGDTLVIDCICQMSGKTGVEMEAMTGASVAALSVYDMTKALSLAIHISGPRLLMKSGGKRDFDDSGVATA